MRLQDVVTRLVPGASDALAAQPTRGQGERAGGHRRCRAVPSSPEKEKSAELHAREFLQGTRAGWGRPGRQEEEWGCVVAKGVFPVHRPSRSWLLPNLLGAVPSLGLAGESVRTDLLPFAPGKSVLDPSKGLHGTLPGVSLLPTQSWCHNQCPRILPALGKAPAWEAAARR